MIASIATIILSLTCLAIATSALKTPTNGDGDDEAFLEVPSRYFNNDEIGKLFANLAARHPQLVRNYTIGRTVLHRPMHALSIGWQQEEEEATTAAAAATATATPTAHLLRPAIAFIANINGDETLGRQLIIYLAQYLTVNYVKSTKIQWLLNNTVIHLLPSANPDGFAVAKEGRCDSLENYVGRTNAAGVDLNRDFPDRLRDEKLNLAEWSKRQPETGAIVNWTLSRQFVLSANFHGGALVASYPYDNSIAQRECCEESLTPDDPLFRRMAHTYADNHPLMKFGKSCNDSFEGGITNGAKWYELNGGMQDFNYVYANCFELTIELSCCKYPDASTLPIEWRNNKRSLLALMKLAHIGIKGLVTDARGYPISGARITVEQIAAKPVWTTKRGEYWRLLLPGFYDIKVEAYDYQPIIKHIYVTENAEEGGEAMRVDFILTLSNSAAAPAPAAGSNRDGEYEKMAINRTEAGDNNNMGFLIPAKIEHHNFVEMEKYLHDVAATYPSLTRLYSIGKSVQNRDLWTMEVFASPGQHVAGVPEFKYVANMHGNEVVGRELLLLLTRYLCENYALDDRVTRLVNTTRMHFLYSMNPDGYEVAAAGRQRSSAKSPDGRANANGKDLNRNFPDQYGVDELNREQEVEVRAVMNWTLSLPFVLSANLHGGALVANYPYDDNKDDYEEGRARFRGYGIQPHHLNPTEDNALFQHLAKIYAQAHPTMHLGEACADFPDEKFPEGITNGAQWYSVTGGMQDWNYVQAGIMELTLELGCDKFPPAAELAAFWRANREPLLQFVEQTHNAVHGFVRSSIGTPVAGAMITLDDGRHATYSAAGGDYWRLALPGRHNVTIMADGFMPQRELIEISPTKRSIRLDVSLMHDDPQHWSSANDFRIIENVIKTRYHSRSELQQQMMMFEEQHRDIVTLAEFGSIKMTLDMGGPAEGKFKLLIVSSVFDGVTPLGNEIIMNMVRHLIAGYKLGEPQIVRILRNAVLYFVPVTHYYDQLMQSLENNQSICSPLNTDQLRDPLVPDEASGTFTQFLESNAFDLMLTFSAGHADLRTSKTDRILEQLGDIVARTQFVTMPLHCSGSSSSSPSEEAAAIDVVADHLFRRHHVPLFALGLACCATPLPADVTIAATWRRSLERLRNFLQLVETGVAGRVQDGQGRPLRAAWVRVRGHNITYRVTKNAARYQIILPPASYMLEFAADGYASINRTMTIDGGHILAMKVIKLMPEQQQQHANDTTTVTTISGFVLDNENHPIANAKVSATSVFGGDEQFLNFTDSLGAYTIVGPHLGDIIITVEAPHYARMQRRLHVATPPDDRARGIVFHLNGDDHVLGMPRLVFIILASIVSLLAVIVCVLCIQCLLLRRQHRNKPYYNFSLLPQKGKDLFEDDADEGETELFRSPIKRRMVIQPYYDDDDERQRIVMTDDEDDRDNDDDDDDDDVHDDIGSNDSGDEIIMLDKRHH